MSTPVHPFVVYFPIALLLLAFMLDIFGLVSGSERVREATLLVLLLGFIGAVGAVGTGLYTHGRMTQIPQDLYDVIGVHEKWAFITIAVAVIALTFRVFAKSRSDAGGVTGFIALLLLLGAASGVGLTAYYGGETAHRVGHVTVVYEKKQEEAPPEPEEMVPPQTPSRDFSPVVTPARREEQYGPFREYPAREAENPFTTEEIKMNDR